jgi:hypothetical protein
MSAVILPKLLYLLMVEKASQLILKAIFMQSTLPKVTIAIMDLIGKNDYS